MPWDGDLMKNLDGESQGRDVSQNADPVNLLADQASRKGGDQSRCERRQWYQQRIVGGNHLHPRIENFKPVTKEANRHLEIPSEEKVVGLLSGRILQNGNRKP